LSFCKPDRAEFMRLARKYNLIPVTREVQADLETPASCFLKLADPEHSFLLESVEGGEKLARFSFIGLSPSCTFESKGRHVKIARAGKKAETFQTKTDPLAELEKLLKSFRQAPVGELPPFSGGAVGYMGYDVVRFFEKVSDKNKDPYGIPDSFFMLTDTLLAFDHVQKKIKVVCNVHLEPGVDAGRAYQKAEAKIEEIIHDLQMPAPRAKLLAATVEGPVADAESNFSPASFKKIVLKAKEYITKGDIFQVVLSQAFRAKVRSESFDVYRALRSINPSPYMFYLDAGPFQLVGSSPEVHVRCEDGKATLRPIAGTRPRGKSGAKDKALEKELLADIKERAEHLMLVDLGRNDLGRVCDFKSVKVPEFMTIERYSHVMHIVSRVEGRLSKKKTPFDLLRATFPAGTVSGAPKVRAMEIIDELENRRRGFYAGIVGYFSYSGNLDSCIAIRTLLVKDGYATVQAGAGVVADSKPENEYLETVNKAKGLLKAVRIAEDAK
jgi:anthranilate synthase component I